MNSHASASVEPIDQARTDYAAACAAVELAETDRDLCAAYEMKSITGAAVIRFQDDELTRRQTLIGDLREQLRLARSEADQMRLKRDQLLFVNPADKREGAK
jgi:hypothetical protein